MMNVFTSVASPEAGPEPTDIIALPATTPKPVLKLLSDWTALIGASLPCRCQMRDVAPPPGPMRLLAGAGLVGSGRKPADLVWLESMEAGGWPFQPPVAGQPLRRSFPERSAARTVELLRSVIATRMPHYVEVTEWSGSNRPDAHGRLALPVMGAAGKVELLILWERMDVTA